MLHRKKILLSVIAACFALGNVMVSYAAEASHIDGTIVAQRCDAAINYFEKKQPQSMYDVGWCLGFIKGLSNGYHLGARSKGSEPDRYCVPEGVTLGEQIKTVVNYLRALPADQMKQDGSALSMIALIKAYACNKTDSSKTVPQIAPQENTPPPQDSTPPVTPPPSDSTPMQ